MFNLYSNVFLASPLGVTSSFFSMLISILCAITILVFSAFITTKAGIWNLGIEGTIIVGTTIGFIYARSITQSNGEVYYYHPTIAILFSSFFAMLAAGGFSLIFAFAVITLKVDQKVFGIVYSLIGIIFSVFVARYAIGDSSKLADTYSIPNQTWIDFNMISLFTDESNEPRFYINIVSVLIVFIAISLYFIFTKSKYGLRIKQCGENVSAAYSFGINVNRVRYVSTFISGLLSGLGGFAFSMALGGYSGTSIGLGFIVLAIVIMSNYRIKLSLIYIGIISLAFTLTRNEHINIFIREEHSVINYSILTIPYILSFILLVVSSIVHGNKNQPKDIGVALNKNYIDD